MYKPLFLLLSFFILQTNAQDFDFQIDHSSLIVNNLDTTADFYSNILKLKEIPHPDKAPGFRWFQVQGNSQLHLIYKDTVVMKKHKSMHLCLSTPNLETFIKHLEDNNIEYEDWPGTKGAVTLRTDGVRQIYLTDPEGYWIEVNNAKHD
ncbi:VOC family protein [Arenibacter palladensis]|uniref:VOC family protein n=1 Tax=Arenibacter palladensis TaxID=237373 RepID=UPI0026E4841A|nr:VOC family protein [Arenibacter palladensis]MDO6602646.1 VOC family protein [Arenibacter palladensis]|tara:strand:- start:4532 stop:4978 length:447 start_codon:yes stop_codon:yes gene_type:complete